MGFEVAGAALLEAFGGEAAVAAIGEGALGVTAAEMAAGVGVGGVAMGGAGAATGLAVGAGAVAGSDLVTMGGATGAAGGGYGAVAAAGGGLSGLGGTGQLIQGAAGLASAAGLGQSGAAAAKTADPFGPYRDQYAQQLSALTSNPSSITSTPGYTAGMEGVTRSLASQGYQGSGNMMKALQDYSGNFYKDQVTQLSTLAGANFSPATAGQIQANTGVNQTQLVGQSLNSLAAGTSLASGTGGLFGN